MAYATEQDMRLIYTGSVIDRIAYSRDLNAPDPEMIQRALESATNEINMYLSVAFTMPLSRIPPMVVQLAVDIALYRMALTNDKMTTQIEDRYKMAIKSLEMIAAGKLGLGIDDRDPDGNDDGLGVDQHTFSTMNSVLV